MELRFKKIVGADIKGIAEKVAAVRIAVFRAYPYIYDGSLDYELGYLKTYWQSEKAMAFCVYDGEELVGAATCIPLQDETAEVKAPFVANGMDIDSIFYFGESVLLPKYRGEGIGHRFFEARENHAKSTGRFKWASFCSVIRPENHAMRPFGYLPLEEFWTKKGYIKNNLTSIFVWKDMDQTEETEKKMVYWQKELKKD